VGITGFRLFSDNGMSKVCKTQSCSAYIYGKNMFNMSAILLHHTLEMALKPLSMNASTEQTRASRVILFRQVVRLCIQNFMNMESIDRVQWYRSRHSNHWSWYDHYVVSGRCEPSSVVASLFWTKQSYIKKQD